MDFSRSGIPGGKQYLTFEEKQEKNVKGQAENDELTKFIVCEECRKEAVKSKILLGPDVHLKEHNVEGQTIQDKEHKDFGKKYDEGKPMMDLLSPTALTEIAKVMTFGSKKYSRHNWRDGLSWSRVLAAALRHIFAFINGEDKDEETGLSHIAHASCCLMFLLDYETTRKTFDDRYRKKD